MKELEQALARIGRDLYYPATPQIAGAVGERLRAESPRRTLRARWSVVAAVLALLLAAGGALAAAPSVRHTVLDWLGLRSVRIERAPALPAPPPGRVARSLELGRRTTLSAARSRLRFPVLVPSLVPDEVYLGPTPAGGRVTLAYAPRPSLPRAGGTEAGMLITEFRGLQPAEFLGKTLGPGTSARPVTVEGEPAVWISGRPHEVVFMDARGTPQEDNLRLAGDTLLWRHGAVLIRIEAHIPLLQALKIAQSMH
jgi:hypothetical protein